MEEEEEEEEKYEMLTPGSNHEGSSSLVLGMEHKLSIVQGFHSDFESAIRELQAGV